MNKKFFRNLEIIGVVFIGGLATLLHFVYELTDGSIFSILFGSVNESVWENTKIFLVAYAVWAVVEILVSNVHFKRCVVAKVTGVYFMAAFIIVCHYVSVLFTGESNSVVDIVIGFVSVILSQLISYKMIVGDGNLESYFVPSLFLLALFFVGIFSFTAFPPHLGLFRDENTGFYGIVPEYIDKGAVALSANMRWYLEKN